MGPKKVISDGAVKNLKRITVDTKKEIIAKHESGVRVSDLAKEYDMAKSTICTILKNKDAFKKADVSKGVTKLSKQRSQVLQEVEKLLLVWINEKGLKGDTLNGAVICEKALELHRKLQASQPSTSDETVSEFKASRGWFEKFRRRTRFDRESGSEVLNSDHKQTEGLIKPKKVQTKTFYPKCDEVQSDPDLSMQDFWKDHLNVLHCINLFAWNNVSYSALQSAWRKLRSDSMSHKYIKEEETDVVQDIVSKTLEVEIHENDKEVLLDEQNENIIEEGINATTSELRDICCKWSEVQAFIRKHHPDKTITNRVLETMNDNVMSHFQKILKQRKR